MHVLRKGKAFPQIRRRSRGSSLAGPSVIWTSLKFSRPLHGLTSTNHCPLT